ncbi:hypothetical protein [Vannielia litorea]|nr:hypothetical protein [Vannielia litorea]
MTRHLTLALSLMLIATGSVEAQNRGQGNGPFLKKFMRDVEEAKRDFRRKIGGNVRIERAPAQRQAAAPRGPVIRRESGLVATSIRPEARPGAEVAAVAATGLPVSRAGQRLEMLLQAGVATGEIAPEVAQVIRAGSFPTMDELEERTAGVGNGWLPGGATLALVAGKVECRDGGAGGCVKVAEDPALADVREEIAVIEAQAESVLAVVALPGMAEALADVAAERAEAGGQEREYPVARGDELPSIDSLLDARAD